MGPGWGKICKVQDVLKTVYPGQDAAEPDVEYQISLKTKPQCCNTGNRKN